jgi:hypothetical protein
LKVSKALIIREDDGALLVAEVIEYEGSLWLVPAWTTKLRVIVD